MGYKRILTIQDISCVGKCSTTVAMPILSACGHEVCVLPTAVLSTHTGGFSHPVVHYMDSILDDIRKHWEKEGVRFDIIVTGYLGSISAVDAVLALADTLLARDGELIVDPAMADHGRLYSGLNDAYAEAMKKLCDRAHILMPNITEAAMLTGEPFQDPEAEYVTRLLEGLSCRSVVLTGVGYSPEETGVEILDKGVRSSYTHPRIPKNYHGTGDIFASCFTGARACGKDIISSAKIAADFTHMSIEHTWNDPEGSYGVKFEPFLWRLKDMLL